MFASFQIPVSALLPQLNVLDELNVDEVIWVNIPVFKWFIKKKNKIKVCCASGCVTLSRLMDDGHFASHEELLDVVAKKVCFSSHSNILLVYL